MTEIIGRPSEEEVGLQASKGATWAVGLLVARHVITFATTMVTSRLVSPSDTGVAGIAATFVAFMVLLDTGLTWATVQSKSLARKQVDTMFWIGAAGGLTLFFASLVASPLLAGFFRSPEVEKLGWVLGLTILFNSLTIQPSALLKRALRQKHNNIIDALSLVVSSVLAMGMAYIFRNYWALVLQAMLYPLFRFCLLLFSTKHRIRFPEYDRSVVPILRKGLGFAASNYVTYIQLYLPLILIGRTFGDAALGYYTKALALKAMPTMYASLVVTDIVISSMAIFQSQPQKLGEFYRKALKMIAVVGCPLGAMLFPLAPEAVSILYGSQWGQSVPMLQLMAVSAMIAPVATSFAWLFLSSGKARQQLYLNVFLSIIVSCLLMALYSRDITIQEAIIADVVVCGLLVPLIGAYASHRAVGLKVWSTVTAIFPILIASIAAAVSAGAVSEYASFPASVGVLVKLAVGILVYFAFLNFTYRREMTEIAEGVRSVVHRWRK